jgi:sec-independent protein translocase protein TatC
LAEEPKEDLKQMGLLDHLEELRSTLIWSLIVWIGLSLAIWAVSRPVLTFFITALPVKTLYFYSPTEAFMVQTKISFVLGILVAFPYIFYRVWRFISPGLFKREKGLAFPLIVSSMILFYLGLAFAYFVMMPFVIKFFVKFGTANLQPLFSVEKYFNFVAKLCFAFGLVFQAPLVIIVLTWMGVVSARTLLRQWRWAIVLIFSVSAVLTPPDVISQTFMAVPLTVLFFGSCIASLVVEKRRKKGREGETP